MQFALNYSPQADELIREQMISIDLFKCADWPELVTPAQKLCSSYVHFPLHAGNPHSPKPDLDDIRRWMKQTTTNFVNVHLSATNEDFPDIPLDSKQSDHAKRVLEQMVHDVSFLADAFGKETIIVENVPHHIGREEIDVLRVSTEPDVIRMLVENIGCGFLLDIDHARVTAHTTGITLDQYLEGLPIEKMKELHMTGTRMRDGWMQSHLSMLEEDWRIFDRILEKIKKGEWPMPEVFAFEYGGIGPDFGWRSEKSVIEQQVPLFREKIRESGLEKEQR